MDKEYDTKGNMKLSHIPDLDKDWLPEESTTPEESIPTQCSPHLIPAQDQVLPPGGSLGSRGSTPSPQSSHNTPFSSNIRSLCNKWADRVLNAINDIDSDSNESAVSNTTNSDDEHGDNDFHANVASALSESNW